MWQAHIEHLSIADRVSCVIIKRPDYELDFANLFPAAEIDLVWPELSDTDHETDILRHRLYPQVLGRPIYYVRPAMKLHNSQIREYIRAGRLDWTDYIAPGAYSVFREMNGPERMKAALDMLNKP